MSDRTLTSKGLFPCAFAAVAAIFCTISNQAVADYIPPCDVPSGIEAHAFPTDLPIGLTHFLWDKFGEIVPPGEEFDSTDVVVTRKSRRAIFVWSRGTRWVIATEHGGIGYNDPVFAFDILADGLGVSLVGEEIAFPETVCSAAIELMGH
jgi:hypothetical protein